MTQEISRNDYFKLISETGRIPKDDEYEIIPLDLSVYPLNEDTVRIADKNFTEDMVNDFMDMLPPACWRSDCAQIGEPSSHRIDENGNGKATYATFKRIAEGIWEYCGDCFRGENVKRGKELPYV